MTSGDGLFETAGQGNAAPVVLVPSGEDAGRAGREPLFPLSPVCDGKNEKPVTPESSGEEPLPEPGHAGPHTWDLSLP